MSGIDNAKKVMGWVPQKLRPACGDCVRLQLHPPRADLRCGKGGFFTNRFAICDEHEPMHLTGSTPK